MKSMKLIMESFKKYIAEQEEEGLDDDMMTELLGLLKSENTEAVIQGIGMAEMFMDPEEIIEIVMKNNFDVEALVQGGENSIISRLLEIEHDGIAKKVFAILSKHLDWERRRLIVISPDTPPELLVFFVKDEDASVRSFLAKNRNTPLKALYILAKDEDEDVRSSLASSRHNPPEVMEILAKDEDEAVRASLARNPTAPPEVLEILAKSDTGDGWMISAVLKNPSTTPEVINAVIKYMPDDFLTRSDTSTGLNLVVANPNTTPQVLAFLAGHYSKFFRNKVANHPNATVEVLRLLQRDEYLPTRRAAQNRLKKMLNK